MQDNYGYQVVEGRDAVIDAMIAENARLTGELEACKSLRDEAVTGWNEQAELRKARERELEAELRKARERELEAAYAKLAQVPPAEVVEAMRLLSGYGVQGTERHNKARRTVSAWLDNQPGGGASNMRHNHDIPTEGSGSTNHTAIRNGTDAEDTINALRAALDAAESRARAAEAQRDAAINEAIARRDQAAHFRQRVERAEQAHAHVEGMCLMYRAAMWAVIAKPGDTNPIRRVLMLPDEDGTLHDAALRGGEESV